MSDADSFASSIASNGSRMSTPEKKDGALSGEECVEDVHSDSAETCSDNTVVLHHTLKKPTPPNSSCTQSDPVKGDDISQHKEQKILDRSDAEQRESSGRNSVRLRRGRGLGINNGSWMVATVMQLGPEKGYACR